MLPHFQLNPLAMSFAPQIKLTQSPIQPRPISHLKSKTNPFPFSTPALATPPQSQPKPTAVANSNLTPILPAFPSPSAGLSLGSPLAQSQPNPTASQLSNLSPLPHSSGRRPLSASDLAGVGASASHACAHHGVPQVPRVVLAAGLGRDDADVGTVQRIWEVHWGGR